MTHVEVAHGSPNVTVYLGRLKLTHSTLKLSGSAGLVADGTLPDFAENRFEQNSAAPVQTSIRLLGSLDGASSYNPVGLENGLAYIDVSFGDNYVLTAQAWHRLDVPYRLSETAYVPDLSVEAGATILFAAGSALTLGSLTAVGTDEAMIRFLGDTETPGHWEGLIIGDGEPPPSSPSTLAYVEVAYGGTPLANINIAQPIQVGITDCYIHDSAMCGVNLHIDADYVLENNEYENNAGGDVCQPEEKR
jgi:hypothetical protein